MDKSPTTMEKPGTSLIPKTHRNMKPGAFVLQYPNAIRRGMLLP